MKIEIDGASIRSERDIHEFLSRSLEFGTYYGANLDALWDRLSTDVERPVEIVWKQSELSKQALGNDVFAKFHNLFLRVQAQDESHGLVDRLTVIFE